MQHVDLMIGVAAVALGIVALSACSTPPHTSAEVTAAPSVAPGAAAILAAFPPPPKRAEIPPPAPSAQALWDCGHWSWSGERYVWIPGRYIERPDPHANWLPGYWQQQEAGGWAWTEGRWRS
jgi:WXXGXW repeat (2 copies)